LTTSGRQKVISPRVGSAAARTPGKNRLTAQALLS
jgi:hypothetical protein